jgi:hypothetical protein
LILILARVVVVLIPVSVSLLVYFWEKCLYYKLKFNRLLVETNKWPPKIKKSEGKKKKGGYIIRAPAPGSHAFLEQMFPDFNSAWGGVCCNPGQAGSHPRGSFAPSMDTILNSGIHNNKANNVTLVAVSNSSSSSSSSTSSTSSTSSSSSHAADAIALQMQAQRKRRNIDDPTE